VVILPLQYHNSSKNNNAVCAERVVSTTATLVADKYKAAELKVEYNHFVISDNWDASAAGGVSFLPKKPTSNKKKSAHANSICLALAQTILIGVNKTTKSATDLQSQQCVTVFIWGVGVMITKYILC
jgi:hypothetical protein